MKLFTRYWGVEIQAENDREKDVLKKLAYYLPPTATESYEEGVVEVKNTLHNDDPEHRGYTVIIAR